MIYDHVDGDFFIICHFTKMMCNNTDLVGRRIIDNIKSHDCDYEKDEFGVEIGNIFQHNLGVNEVVCISNGFVECKIK